MRSRRRPANAASWLALRESLGGRLPRRVAARPFGQRAAVRAAAIDGCQDADHRLRACVVLGFSRDGRHLLSYTASAEASARMLAWPSSSSFSSSSSPPSCALVVWRFDGPGRPVVLVAAAPLFGTMGADADGRGGGASPLFGEDCQLSVVMFESADSQLLICHGTLERHEEDERLCHVTVLPSPMAALAAPRSSGGLPFVAGLHFAYRQCDGYQPRLEPALTLLPSAAAGRYSMVLNCGVGVLALELELHSAGCRLARPDPAESSAEAEMPSSSALNRFPEWSAVEVSEGSDDVPFEAGGPASVQWGRAVAGGLPSAVGEPTGPGPPSHPLICLRLTRPPRFVDVEDAAARVLSENPQRQGARLLHYDLSIAYLSPSDCTALVLLIVACQLRDGSGGGGGGELLSVLLALRLNSGRVVGLGAAPRGPAPRALMRFDGARMAAVLRETAAAEGRSLRARFASPISADCWPYRLDNAGMVAILPTTSAPHLLHPLLPHLALIGYRQ